MGQDRYPLGSGLGDEQTIKGIAVVEGKLDELIEVPRLDGEQFHGVAVQVLAYQGRDGHVQRQRAEAGFDGDFPQAGDAHQASISALFNHLTGVAT